MYPWFQARCRSDKPTITLQRYDIISDFANVAWQKFDFGNQLTEIPLIVCKKTWVGYDYCLLPQEAFSAVLVLKYKTTRTTMKVIRVEFYSVDSNCYCLFCELNVYCVSSNYTKLVSSSKLNLSNCFLCCNFTTCCNIKLIIRSNSHKFNSCRVKIVLIIF